MYNTEMADITRILQQLKQGDSNAIHQLVELVYGELHQIASAKMAAERPGHTLDATGLVHEAFLKLAPNQAFESRRHFFGAASEAMRRILVDRARARNAEKRGGHAIRLDIQPGELALSPSNSQRLVDLNTALEKFELHSPEKAELVKLRYFVGLTIREAAEILGISTATADRHWTYAKSWLQAEVQSQQG